MRKPHLLGIKTKDYKTGDWRQVFCRNFDDKGAGTESRAMAGRLRGSGWAVVDSGIKMRSPGFVTLYQRISTH